MTLLLSLFLIFTGNAHATPAEVLIIRHGEKVSDKLPDLSPKGQQRANALPKLFTKDKRFTDHGLPVAIYAAATGTSGAKRTMETVAPLAKKLKLKLIDKYDSDDYEEVAEEILKNKAYDGKTVVICWARDEIHKMVEEFGGGEVEKWPKAFDQVWRLRFKDNKFLSLEKLPQKLLPGDSPVSL
jgi:broad specificity phosphatase PhoE